MNQLQNTTLIHISVRRRNLESMIQVDPTHLHALEVGRSSAQQSLSLARNENERALRAVWLAQYEKEIAHERSFLGLDPEADASDLTLDELASDLSEFG